jgi:hypothetical protein
VTQEWSWAPEQDWSSTEAKTEPDELLADWAV